MSPALALVALSGTSTSTRPSWAPSPAVITIAILVPIAVVAFLADYFEKPARRARPRRRRR